MSEFRYPYGESYQDLITRINPFLIQLLRSNVPIIIIAHFSIIKCLYAYLTMKPMEVVSKVTLPPNTVFKFEPDKAKCTETR